ncbi:MAG: Tsi3 family protein [Pseudomonadota bacterium]
MPKVNGISDLPRLLGSGLACLIFLIFWTSDARSGSSEAPTPTFKVTAGVSVQVPEDFQAMQKAGTLHVIQSGDLRSPMSMILKLQHDEPTLPNAHFEAIDGVGIYYLIDQSDHGGSGGPEWHMTGWRVLGAQWLVISARQQSELGAPDFTAALSVLASAQHR